MKGNLIEVISYYSLDAKLYSTDGNKNSSMFENENFPNKSLRSEFKVIQAPEASPNPTPNFLSIYMPKNN